MSKPRRLAPGRLHRQAVEQFPLAAGAGRAQTSDRRGGQFQVVCGHGHEPRPSGQPIDDFEISRPGIPLRRRRIGPLPLDDADANLPLANPLGVVQAAQPAPWQCRADLDAGSLPGLDRACASHSHVRDRVNRNARRTPRVTAAVPTLAKRSLRNSSAGSLSETVPERRFSATARIAARYSPATALGRSSG